MKKEIQIILSRLSYNYWCEATVFLKKNLFKMVQNNRHATLVKTLKLHGGRFGF